MFCAFPVVRFSCRINRVLLSDLLETVVVTENAKSLLFWRFIFACRDTDPKQCFFADTLSEIGL
jgi:hypothetical protein